MRIQRGTGTGATTTTGAIITRRATTAATRTTRGTSRVEKRAQEEV